MEKHHSFKVNDESSTLSGPTMLDNEFERMRLHHEEVNRSCCRRVGGARRRRRGERDVSDSEPAQCTGHRRGSVICHDRVCRHERQPHRSTGH